MNSDVYFTIGRHQKQSNRGVQSICQDYGLASESHVIISDGCSTAEDSDFGARLLTRSTDINLTLKKTFDYDLSDPKPFLYNIIEYANGYRKTLGLPIAALSATLAWIYFDTNFIVNIIGDGVVAAVTWENKINITQFRHTAEAPCYLRYYLNEKDLEQYRSEYGTNMEVTNWTLSENGDIEKKEISIEPLGDKMNFNFYLPNELFHTVAVMSDGVASFRCPIATETNKTMESVPLPEIVKELLAFKGYTGQFVQRRAQKAMQVFKNKNWINEDDVSIGVITILDEGKNRE